MEFVAGATRDSAGRPFLALAWASEFASIRAAMPRASRLLCWTLLLVIAGGHWGALQLVAWTAMVIDFSREAPVATAVSMTFDGQNPCSLCKTVERGMADDGPVTPVPERAKLGKLIKTDGVLVTVVFVPHAAPVLTVLTFADEVVVEGQTAEPPTRPPCGMG